MHDYSPILAPVVALVAWTLLVMVWMMATRMARIPAAGDQLRQHSRRLARRRSRRQGRSRDAQWKSHNYNHLMEQPTIFYAIALTLALMDFGGGINYSLAWGYVGLRMLHSLVQGTVNVVRYRLALFGLASLCLIGLTVHAGLRDPPRLRRLSAETGGQLDMGRPAELADRPDPLERDSLCQPASWRHARRSRGCS